MGISLTGFQNYHYGRELRLFCVKSDTADAAWARG
jgi:hypothetical protein